MTVGPAHCEHNWHEDAFIDEHAVGRLCLLCGLTQQWSAVSESWEPYNPATYMPTLKGAHR